MRPKGGGGWCMSCGVWSLQPCGLWRLGFGWHSGCWRPCFQQSQRVLRSRGCGNGTRPPCSEVVGLLRVPVSRQPVPGCVGKEGRPGVETAWEGPGREAGVGVLRE